MASRSPARWCDDRAGLLRRLALWRWPLWGALALVAVFLSIDVSFFIANLYKVLDGGWVPLLLGAAMFI